MSIKHNGKNYTATEDCHGVVTLTPVKEYHWVNVCVKRNGDLYIGTITWEDTAEEAARAARFKSEQRDCIHVMRIEKGRAIQFEQLL